MCRKRASAATWLRPLIAGALAAGLAAPALAWPGAKPKPAAAKAADASAPAATQKAGPAERAAADRLDPLARAAFWGRESDLDPGEAEAGARFAAALRALGRPEEAAAAAGRVLALHPDDEPALLELARARIAAGQGFYALEPLRRARQAAPKDWRPLSLLGVAYGQARSPENAAAAFAAALRLSPRNPAVLGNMGMAAASSGDLARAETLLRRAVAEPAATAAERQDLAYVLGLQGRTAEAERLMRQDLPPETVDANLAYLRGLGGPLGAPVATASTAASSPF